MRFPMLKEVEPLYRQSLSEALPAELAEATMHNLTAVDTESGLYAIDTGNVYLNC